MTVMMVILKSKLNKNAVFLTFCPLVFVENESKDSAAIFEAATQAYVPDSDNDEDKTVDESAIFEEATQAYGATAGDSDGDVTKVSI